MTKYGMGEKRVLLHADNCSGNFLQYTFFVYKNKFYKKIRLKSQPVNNRPLKKNVYIIEELISKI